MIVSQEGGWKRNFQNILQGESIIFRYILVFKGLDCDCRQEGGWKQNYQNI